MHQHELRAHLAPIIGCCSFHYVTIMYVAGVGKLLCVTTSLCDAQEISAKLSESTARSDRGSGRGAGSRGRGGRGGRETGSGKNTDAGDGTVAAGADGVAASAEGPAPSQGRGRGQGRGSGRGRGGRRNSDHLTDGEDVDKVVRKEASSSGPLPESGEVRSKVL